VIHGQAASQIGGAMYFTEESLERIHEEFALIQHRHNKLVLAFFGRLYRFSQSKEYAQHGFMRRLGTLVRCIKNVFRILPPDRGDDPPAKNDLHDATINIQAFVFNIFGAIDNLALIWVTETELKQKNGQALPSSWIGLGPKNSFVRESLPQAVRDHLESMNSW